MCSVKKLGEAVIGMALRPATIIPGVAVSRVKARPQGLACR